LTGIGRRQAPQDALGYHHPMNQHDEDLPADIPAAEEPEPSPQQRPDYEDPVDDAVDDSFPASDPPSWSQSTATLQPDIL
jgi:hypothetical protein